MGFGTFDGLHPGHMFFLKQLSALGDELFVIVARDKNVKSTKGKSAHYSEEKRLEAIDGLSLVNHAFIGHDNDYYYWINKFQPDVIGLGYDQKANTHELKEMFPNIEIVRLKALEPEKYKSSLINGKKK